MPRHHQYTAAVTWTGNRGRGTSDYRAYDRSYKTASPGRPTLDGSSDPAFRGDAERWNPELLLVAALSQCHLLSYLHVCAVGGVVVVDYADEAVGIMAQDEAGGGQFIEVTLRPIVTVAELATVQLGTELHDLAAQRCFIASSVGFPVRHEPLVRVAARTDAGT